MHRSHIACSALLSCLVFAGPALAQFPSYTQFETGCAGTVGVPLLEAEPGFLPVLGGTFRARLSNVPDGLSLGIVGLSTTDWVGFDLPLDLVIVGMLPGRHRRQAQGAEGPAAP